MKIGLKIQTFKNITLPKINKTPPFNSDLAIYKDLSIKMKTGKALSLL